MFSIKSKVSAQKLSAHNNCVEASFSNFSANQSNSSTRIPGYAGVKPELSDASLILSALCHGV